VIDSLDTAAGVSGPRRVNSLTSFPNPAPGTADLVFEAAIAGRVTVGVYDAVGRLVRTIDGGWCEPGKHRLEWDGRDASGRRVASGMYFLSARIGEQTLSKKVVLLE
jgi:YD repeat-containing protein